MTSTAAPYQGTEKLYHPIDRKSYRETVGKLCEEGVRRLLRFFRANFVFHLSFALIGAGEIVALTIFFPLLLRSSVVAISLAALFLTAFTDFVIRLYMQSRKGERLVELRDHYIHACKGLLHFQEGIPEHHLAMANACCKLASLLQEVEYRILRPPRWLEALAPSLEKLSCWSYWYVVLTSRELLLSFAIDEHIKVVKCEPTNLEVHAALANAYVMLSSLYVEPSNETERYIPPKRLSLEMKELFRVTSERAIEEFKILNTYAPEDPWVHSQLAYSYRDLHMPLKEIKEYETIMRLRPDDFDTLFKLGVRYFQNGFNAKGLRVYEALKRRHYKKADDLIHFYGSL